MLPTQCSKLVYMYIHQRKDWPKFFWDEGLVNPTLVRARERQARLLGRVQDWGFQLKLETTLERSLQDVISSSEIEGERLPVADVRSSLARKLGLEAGDFKHVSREVEGVVEMTLDATRNYQAAFTNEVVVAWQAALFPNGRNGLVEIQTGHYRKHPKSEPMQVVSGGFGHPKVHFQAPDSELVPKEMNELLEYLNEDVDEVDALLRAAIAHLWFLTIHPFDDGNGRVARAITDRMLCRADEASYRFYSMSAAILTKKKQYYEILERTQKDDLEITDWLRWFLETLEEAISASETLLDANFKKARFWLHHLETELNGRQRCMLNKMFDGFEGNLTSKKWAKINKVSQDTAGRDINDLISKGILSVAPAGGRSTHYLIVHPE